jgi:predicted ATPase/DNA-binding NarL/FixJ family response regulator/transcriptional regulator with XRE-family HTH domain
MTAALTFGGWLKRRRQGLGLTQKELARRVGYAAVTLRKVEADELRPSGPMARKLAEVLELTPEEQAQFVRFGRDEALWDDIALPGRVALSSISPARVAPVATPALDEKQEAAPAHSGEHDRPSPGPLLDVPLSAGYSARSRPKRNLPAQTTPLIGREQELAELAQLLADPGRRLVTILSAGGMGKTHLAIAAAWQQVERFAHGACWVPLAPLTDPNELVLAIAAALGLQLQGERTPEQQVGDYLQAKHLLLVLDNFEHLLEGAPLVGELLASAPQLSILVTSRQRLKLSSETVVFLDGLRFPSEQNIGALDCPAVQLYLLHARRVDPHYQPDTEDVAGIVAVCRLVHGMPLGILLAAAWASVISPPEIAAEIGRDLGFLQADMPDMPARQRSLRAVFLHTWNRLHPAERAVFMRLSVFRGGTTSDVARLVIGATVDVLAGLVDKALLRRLPSGRLDIHELLRQFAAEQLAGASAVEVGTHEELQHDILYDAGGRHSRYYLDLLAVQEHALQGPQQRAALDSIRADFENISVAWRWAVQEHEFALLAPAIHPLFLYCDVRGTYREGILLFAAAAAELGTELAASTGDGATLQTLRAQVRVRLGACEVALGNYERGTQLLQNGLPLLAQDWERALALAYLGMAATEQGDLALSRTQLHDSLAISQAVNDPAGTARALHHLQRGESDYIEVHRICLEILAFARTAGRLDLIATELIYLGFIKSLLGDYAAAKACWLEGMELCDTLELRNVKAWALDYMGFAAWCQGETAAAVCYIEEALAINTELGLRSSMGKCLADLTPVLVSQGEVQRALAVARQAVAITSAIDNQMLLSLSLCYLGAASIAAGEPVEAGRTLLEAIQRGWHSEYFRNVMIAFYYFAELLILESLHTAPAGALARTSLAVTLLSCVRTQTATWQVFRDKATQLQAEIAGSLPAAVLAAAVERGQRRNLAEIVSALLSDRPGELIDESPEMRTPASTDSGTAGAQVGGVLIEPLTARELAVLRLVAAGRSNQDIAAELDFTPGTAKWYVSQILGKLGVQSRTQAVARGRELGLLA